MASLLDQMKKAGLVNEHKAKQAKKEKYQQAKKQQQTGESAPSAAKLAAEAFQQKAEKDRQLNLVRQQQQTQKAKQAELKQLLSAHAITDFQGEIAFHFVDTGQVKTLKVNAKTQAGLVAGSIRIVRWEASYVLVAATCVDKINQRDPDCLIAQSTGQEVSDEGLSAEDREYYAKFAIPDDLIW